MASRLESFESVSVDGARQTEHSPERDASATWNSRSGSAAERYGSPGPNGEWAVRA